MNMLLLLSDSRLLARSSNTVWMLMLSNGLKNV